MEVRAVSEPLARFEAACSACGRRCSGKGSCPGDAMAMLPCRSSRRMEAAGVEPPDWREMMLRDEIGFILI